MPKGSHSYGKKGKSGMGDKGGGKSIKGHVPMHRTGKKGGKK